MGKDQDYIFGIRAVTEAIKSEKEIDKILLIKKPDSHVMNELFPLIREHSIPFQYVPIEKINRITRKNHQGVIAFISHIAYFSIEELVFRCFNEGKDPLVLILDQISDVRNFGAIARSAESMNVTGIVLPEKGSARINADAVKTSAGALLKVPVARVSSLIDTVKFLKNSGLKVIAATEKASNMIFRSDLTGPLAVIIGSEDTGISTSLLKVSDELLAIPMKGEIGSLNVSSAATVVLYEILRQRLINE